MRHHPQSFSFTCLLVLLSFGLSAQLELGVKVGVAAYSGDLSPTNLGIDIDDVNFAAGAYLRYRPTQRFGVRVNGNFGTLSAERNTILRNENGQRQQVTRQFTSPLSEFNLVAELDLLYMGDPEFNFVAPYLYGGVGVLSFNPQAPNADGDLVDLQPLATEGQGLDNTRYAPAPYELTRVIGLLGAGIRARFGGRFVIGLETGLRFTGTDYLDDISDTVVNYNDVLRGPGGTTAAMFSNPAVEDPTEVSDDFEFVRGGRFDDYYYVGGLTIGITIGDGGSNKTGCYSF